MFYSCATEVLVVQDISLPTFSTYFLYTRHQRTGSTTTSNPESLPKFGPS